jgi:hypothetical protein
MARYKPLYPHVTPSQTRMQLEQQIMKEPWQMTRDEWIKEQGKRVSGQSVKKTEKLAKNMHSDYLKIWLSEGRLISAEAFRGYTPDQYPNLFDAVRKALAEGKPVPAEVLTEYPDLKR